MSSSKLSAENIAAAFYLNAVKRAKLLFAYGLKGKRP